MPAASPPRTRATKRTPDDGAKPASRHAGIVSDMPEDDHQLAPVPVAQRPEPEHGGGEPERVADRDQVERRLRRVERLADVGQRDVGDRQVQVRDRRDQDQRDEDEPRPLRGRRHSCRSARRRLDSATHEPLRSWRQARFASDARTAPSSARGTRGRIRSTRTESSGYYRSPRQAAILPRAAAERLARWPFTRVNQALCGEAQPGAAPVGTRGPSCSTVAMSDGCGAAVLVTVSLLRSPCSPIVRIAPVSATWVQRSLKPARNARTT